MTIEEAREQLKDLIHDRESFIITEKLLRDRESFIVGDDDEIYRKDIEALEKALEVLEKQIPKKPTKGKYGHIECACCGWIVESFCGDTVQYLFCPNCGQVIDWSDNDD